MYGGVSKVQETLKKWGMGVHEDGGTELHVHRIGVFRLKVWWVRGRDEMRKGKERIG